MSGPLRSRAIRDFSDGPNDRDVSRLMLIRIRENNHNQIASIGLCLSRGCTVNLAPTLTCGIRARQPLGLRIRQQQLAVLRRPQYVNAQMLRRRRCKRAAVSVFAGTLVGRAPVRFSGFPIHMLVGDPERLDVHAVQDRG